MKEGSAAFREQGVSPRHPLLCTKLRTRQAAPSAPTEDGEKGIGKRQCQNRQLSTCHPLRRNRAHPGEINHF